MQPLVPTIALASLLLSTAPLAQASAPQDASAFSRTRLFANDAVTVTHTRFGPGAREMPHTHDFTLLLVQLTRGQVAFTRGDRQRTRMVDSGHVELVSPGVTHAAANPSQTPWEVMVVAVKRPGPLPKGDDPESQSTTLMAENPDARAMLTIYTPSGLASVQTDPFNRLVIPLMPARIEIRTEEKSTLDLYEPGNAIFLPRDTPYTIRDAGTAPFTAVVVSIP
jgi:quercetin dioxygenase-like cupin family protein